MKGRSNDGSSDAHGRTNLARAENALHSALEKQDLSSRVQCLISDYVLGDVDIFSVCPTGDNDEAQLVICPCI